MNTLLRTVMPGLLKITNTMGKGIARAGYSLPSLNARSLVHKACHRTGLRDFGGESFREPLELLLESFEADANLNVIGRLCVHFDLLRMLESRLRMAEEEKRQPGICDTPIDAPLFITGLPRSGTTLLHSLLAQDPQTRSPQVWEVMYPSPPPQSANYRSDPRIARTEEDLAWLDVLVPKFKEVHLIGAVLPQECIAITGYSFRSEVFQSMYYVSSYRRWYDSQEKQAEYTFHRRFLQHLQWKCPGRYWLLKAPSHLFGLEALTRVYPDARIVMVHRDPLKVLPSCASFSEVLRQPFTNHCIHRDVLGAEIRWKWEEGAHRAVDFRAVHGDLDGRLLDVTYKSLVRDPMGQIARIYDHYGWALTHEAERAMRGFLSANPENKNGRHVYSLKDFGFHPEKERNRFRFYTDRFDVELEKHGQQE